MPFDIFFETKSSNEYKALSQRLKVAADYISANPVDLATRSLRSISADSGLAPATFSRLARALGFDTYEDLRNVARDAVRHRVTNFSDKASRLQDEEQSGDTPPFLLRQSEACVANVVALNDMVDIFSLENAVEHLHEADSVLLLGALGSTGIVEYMAYVANFFSNKFRFANCVGSSVGGSLTDIGESDAILIVTKPPFAKHSIQAAEMAKSQGAYVIVITDTDDCPALPYANTSFVISTKSPQFFSSYAATIVLIETLIGMLVARAGPAAQHRIAEVETRNHRLEETWSK